MVLEMEAMESAHSFCAASTSAFDTGASPVLATPPRLRKAPTAPTAAPPTSAPRTTGASIISASGMRTADGCTTAAGAETWNDMVLTAERASMATTTGYEETRVVRDH